MAGNSPHTIAVVGLGEVGKSFARAIQTAGVRLRVASRDSERSRAAAARLGLPLATDLAAAVGAADFVLLTVTGRTLRAAVEALAPGLRPGAIVADFTAGAPDDVRAAAQLLPDGAASFVDGAIMGSVTLYGARTPVLVSGEAAERLAEVLNGIGFNLRAMPHSHIGDASTVKLLRSVFAKGLEGLVIESVLAAEALGLREEFDQQLRYYDSSPMLEHVDMYLRTHVLHAHRRLPEMEEAEAQLLATGLRSLTTHAAIERYRNTLRLRAGSPPTETLDTAEKATAWLLAAERKLP
jgi:3-hydroxyisobutyrate dehydrogenase-like beta-hydroxyacid dehydrogenase